jgi:ferredoxin
MSKKDRESVLIHWQNAEGFFILKSKDHTMIETCELVSKACPIKIISYKET